MGKHGKHKHKQGFFGGHVLSSKDQWDEWQDSQHLGKSDYVAPGKTVRPEHHKMPVGNYSADDMIPMLLEELQKPLGNKIDTHYRLGCTYKKKGDWANARKHLEIAAAKGHNDAKIELEAIPFAGEQG